MVKEKFEVEEKNKEDLPEERGGGYVEWIIFQGPLGKMKLERTTKPIVLDKKTTYSKRAGSGTKVDYVYSDTDFSQKLRAYKWDDIGENWVEMETEKSGFSI